MSISNLVPQSSSIPFAGVVGADYPGLAVSADKEGSFGDDDSRKDEHNYTKR